MQEGTTSRVMEADRPYGEFYDSYSVNSGIFWIPPRKLISHPDPLWVNVKVKVKVKVKFTLERSTKAQRWSRGIAVLFLYLSAGWGGWSMSCPGHFTPGKETWYHCIRGWVGPRTGLDGFRKSHLPLELDPWTIQPIASHYTD
jgi:hypothetical protein